MYLRKRYTHELVLCILYCKLVAFHKLIFITNDKFAYLHEVCNRVLASEERENSRNYKYLRYLLTTYLIKCNVCKTRNMCRCDARRKSHV